MSDTGRLGKEAQSIRDGPDRPLPSGLRVRIGLVFPASRAQSLAEGDLGQFTPGADGQLRRIEADRCLGLSCTG